MEQSDQTESESTASSIGIGGQHDDQDMQRIAEKPQLLSLFPIVVDHGMDVARDSTFGKDGTQKRPHHVGEASGGPRKQHEKHNAGEATPCPDLLHHQKKQHGRQ